MEDALDQDKHEILLQKVTSDDRSRIGRSVDRMGGVSD